MLMADPVRKKPILQVIREGNPSKKPIPETVILPPGELEEPDWNESFPPAADPQLLAVNGRARFVARREWRRVAPVLEKSAGLADVDAEILRDYCICVARIDQC